MSSRILFRIIKCQVSLYSGDSFFSEMLQFLCFNIPPYIEIMLAFHVLSNTISYMINFILHIIEIGLAFYVLSNTISYMIIWMAIVRGLDFMILLSKYFILISLSIFDCYSLCILNAWLKMIEMFEFFH